jgi:hypothetical protein
MHVLTTFKESFSRALNVRPFGVPSSMGFSQRLPKRLGRIDNYRIPELYQQIQGPVTLTLLVSGVCKNNMAHAFRYDRLQDLHRFQQINFNTLPLNFIVSCPIRSGLLFFTLLFAISLFALGHRHLPGFYIPCRQFLMPTTPKN